MRLDSPINESLLALAGAKNSGSDRSGSVSYTHLTLPTKA